MQNFTAVKNVGQSTTSAKKEKPFASLQRAGWWKKLQRRYYFGCCDGSFDAGAAGVFGCVVDFSFVCDWSCCGCTEPETPPEPISELAGAAVDALSRPEMPFFIM